MQHVVLGGIQDIGGSETLLGASARTFFGSTVVVMAVNRLPVGGNALLLWFRLNV